ncbi:hypothetical protein GCK32_014852, partial [Trichostrongylus colubriformis]
RFFESRNRVPGCRIAGSTLPYSSSFEMSATEEFEGVEVALKNSLQGRDYEEVRRILYGRAYPELQICGEAKARANEGNFELQGYEISAQHEQLRPPRIVGSFEHSLRTTKRFA